MAAPHDATGPRPLKVAVVGAGYFAQYHLDAWRRLQLSGLVELVGIADTDPGQRHAAASRFEIPASHESAEALLDAVKPDLLDIATPPATHLGLVRLAAARQVDCIVQKPLAPDLAQARELVDAGRLAGINVVVHENFRWMPWYREMKRSIDDGLLGQLHGFSFRLRPGDGQGAQAYLARQPYFQKMPRFLVHETVIHLVDTCRYLFGDALSVTARLRRINPVIAGEDAGLIAIEFTDGVSVLIDANRNNDHVASDTRLTMGEAWLEGSGGVMRLDGDGRLYFKPHGGQETAHDYAWRKTGYGGDCVYEMQRAIVRDLVKGVKPVNTGSDYLRNIEIEEAIYQSHEQRRTLTF